MKYKYIILGAGPAGLSFGNYLLQQGEDSFLILEKESEAGGLCRSKDVGGAPLDIGGGHFLDVRRPKVNEFLFGFMPEEEWKSFERDSQIDIQGRKIGHPIEANIWQLERQKQVEYLKSIAVAGCNLGEEIPTKFVEWIYWKLGQCIAEEYMIPYNSKMFSENLDDLGTYWLEKLPNVSFDETLFSCLDKKPYGTQPGHAQFYYPKKYGYGELWKRMADKIKEHIIYNVEVDSIDFEKTMVNDIYEGGKIITTIPWTCFKELTGMPEEMYESIKKLKYSSVQIGYVEEQLDTTAHWIYYPDPNLTYHRILVRHNFLENAKGYWTETNMTRAEKGDNVRTFDNQYAYPLNTIDKPMIMSSILKWARKQNVYGLGRWGEWEHFNSDVTVERAMALVKELNHE